MWEPCHYNQITILKIVVWLRLENIYGSVRQTEAKPKSSKYNLETSFCLGVTVQGLSTFQWLCGPQQIKGKVRRLDRRHTKTLPCLPSMPGAWHLCLIVSKPFPQGTLVKPQEAKTLRNLLPSCPAHHQPRGSSSPLTSSVLWLSFRDKIRGRKKE